MMRFIAAFITCALALLPANLLATGADKSTAVEGMVRGPLTTRLPASFLQLHPCVEVLLDRPAAALLAV